VKWNTMIPGSDNSNNSKTRMESKLYQDVKLTTDMWKFRREKIPKRITSLQSNEQGYGRELGTCKARGLQCHQVPTHIASTENPRQTGEDGRNHDDTMVNATW